MSIVVKTVDGFITEIHGIGLEEYKFGDLVHDVAKPKLRSFEEERGGGYMFKQEGYNFRVDKDGGTDE